MSNSDPKHAIDDVADCDLIGSVYSPQGNSPHYHQNPFFLSHPNVSGRAALFHERNVILFLRIKRKSETNSSFFAVIYRALRQRLSQQQAVSPKRGWHHDVLRGPESDKAKGIFQGAP